MKTIWKYDLSYAGEQSIEMPAGAELLDIQVQKGEPCLWARVDPKQPRVQRKLITHGTGHPTPDTTGDHVGSYQLHGGSIVFHVFEAV